MKIIIFGAGAIGSLFGALLSKNNNVLLFGRKTHIDEIKNNGITIKGKTKLNIKINAEYSFEKISFSPDLLILTVKSFDTEEAIKQVKKIIDKDTKILSLQNGLDNIEKIAKVVSEEKIFLGTTTHAALFSEPGSVEHTGIGLTILGDLNNTKSNFLNLVVKLFNESGIETIKSKNISKDLWGKVIINSSINPLTSIFQCKNGYLLKNPILEKIMEDICKESTSIARVYGIDLSIDYMIEKTKIVINNTSDNFSSMLQSTRKNQKTEIDSINGILRIIGRENNVETPLNNFLHRYISSL